MHNKNRPIAKGAVYKKKNYLLLFERLLFFSEDLESEDLEESFLRVEPELLEEAADLLDSELEVIFFLLYFCYVCFLSTPKYMFEKP